MSKSPNSSYQQRTGRSSIETNGAADELKQTRPMKLVLEDGTELSGRGFGATRAVGGEVVFNTAMTGYVETLTDPSYRGQILLLTYPLIGNYGVPVPRRPGSIDQPYESNQIQVQGLVVQHYVDDHSHHAGVRSLHDWLVSERVPRRQWY